VEALEGSIARRIMVVQKHNKKYHGTRKLTACGFSDLKARLQVAQPTMLLLREKEKV
jgi:hypothetical protein